MTMIVPAGNNKLDWSPKHDKMVKTASAEGEVEVQEEDALYDAAKKAVEAAKDDKQEKEAACGDDDTAVIEVEVEDEVASEGEKSVEEAVAEVVQKAEEAEAVVEAVEEAIGKIEEAVGEVKDAVNSEAVEEAVEEVSEEVSEVPGEEVVDGDVIVESEPVDVEAASSEEFCKFAMLSEPNRKKLVNYWVKQLGYPKDYVALMVKDSEK